MTRSGPLRCSGSLLGLRQATARHLHDAPSDLLRLLDVRGQFNGAVQGVRVEEPGLDDVYEHLLIHHGAVPPGQRRAVTSAPEVS